MTNVVSEQGGRSTLSEVDATHRDGGDLSSATTVDTLNAEYELKVITVRAGKKRGRGTERDTLAGSVRKDRSFSGRGGSSANACTHNDASQSGDCDFLHKSMRIVASVGHKQTNEAALHFQASFPPLRKPWAPSGRLINAHENGMGVYNVYGSRYCDDTVHAGERARAVLRGPGS